MSKFLISLFFIFTIPTQASHILKIKQAIVCHKGKQINGSKFKNFCKIDQLKNISYPNIIVMTETNTELLMLQKKSKMAKLAPKDFCLTEEGTTNPRCILKIIDTNGNMQKVATRSFLNNNTFIIPAISIQRRKAYFLQLEKTPDEIRSNQFLIDLN